MKNINANTTLVTDVKSQEVSSLIVNTDARVYVRMGWLIVLVGIVGFLIWASFAPLDQGAPAQGTVVAASGRKIIQHQTGGTIDDILVKEGDEVKAGQTLLLMNSTVAKSSFEIAQTQLVTFSSAEARLTAERDNAKKISFPKWLLGRKNEPHIAESLMLQEQLFASRQNSLQSELGAVDENIAGLKLQQQGQQESMLNKKQQQSILKEQVESLRELAKDGYVARNRLLDLERSYAQVNGSISEDLGNLGRINRQLFELSLRKTQRIQDFQKEVRAQLSETQKEALSSQNRVKIAEFELNNTAVKAPVDGTIVGLNVFTKGGVVGAGYKLMELVPKHDALIVEGMLAINLIDKVHPGLDVEFVFSAFNTNTTPHIPGKLSQVSADRSTDEKTGMPYYKFQAVVTPEGLKKLGTLHIRPGMPVEMTIKTGERTMMNYLLKPITDRAHSAMKEN